MKTPYFIFLFILLSFSGYTFAQKGQGGNRIQFDVAEYKTKQAAHMIKELSLTDAEVKAFIPLMNEFTEKKFELNRALRAKSRTLRDNPNATQAEYNKALDNYLESRAKELMLEKEYYEKFKTVLPVDKVYRFERAERRFNEGAIAKYKERAGKGNR